MGGGVTFSFIVFLCGELHTHIYIYIIYIFFFYFIVCVFVVLGTNLNAASLAIHWNWWRCTGNHVKSWTWCIYHTSWYSIGAKDACSWETWKNTVEKENTKHNYIWYRRFLYPKMAWHFKNSHHEVGLDHFRDSNFREIRRSRFLKWTVSWQETAHTVDDWSSRLVYIIVLHGFWHKKITQFAPTPPSRQPGISLFNGCNGWFMS